MNGRSCFDRSGHLLVCKTCHLAGMLCYLSRRIGGRVGWGWGFDRLSVMVVGWRDDAVAVVVVVYFEGDAFITNPT